MNLPTQMATPTSGRKMTVAQVRESLVYLSRKPIMIGQDQIEQGRCRNCAAADHFTVADIDRIHKGSGGNIGECDNDHDQGDPNEQVEQNPGAAGNVLVVPSR